MVDVRGRHRLGDSVAVTGPFNEFGFDTHPRSTPGQPVPASVDSASPLDPGHRLRPAGHRLPGAALDAAKEQFEGMSSSSGDST